MNLALKQRKTEILFEVPEFIIGRPVYKLNDCIEFVQKQLVNKGFKVRYFFPRVLYISWDVPSLPALPPPDTTSSSSPSPPQPGKKKPAPPARIKQDPKPKKSNIFQKTAKQNKNAKLVLDV